MLPKLTRSFIFCFMLAGLLDGVGAQTIMDTHGWVTLEKYAHGSGNTPGLNRSHRSEFTGVIDLFKVRRFTATLLIGNTLDISEQASDRYYLDRIIYTYTWGGRFDFKRMVMRIDYHHDCIHLINRPEINGATWWNALQIRAGSRGSFYLYVPEDYRRESDGLIGNLDARIGFSAYRRPTGSLADGADHNYRYEFSNLNRLHIGKYQRWIVFSDQSNKLWITWDGDPQYKSEISLNLMYRGRDQYAGFYYEYHFKDSYEMDREGGMGSIGFRILF